MQHIGTCKQGVAISMRLGAEINQVDPLFSSEPPTWTIIGVGPLFHGLIANGKMEKEEAGETFIAYQEVGDWKNGTYLLTMTWVDESGENRQESLLTIESDPKKEDVREKLDPQDLAHFFEKGEVPDYIPMQSESLPYEVAVEGDEIVIRLSKDLEPNHQYLVYLPPSIKGANGPLQKDWLVYGFDSWVRPLYIGSGEVRRELGAFGKGIEESSVLSRIREAGLKGHQLKRLDANAQPSDFELMETDDEFYYPLTRFVLYESLLQLSDQLISGWIMGDEMDGGLVNAIKRYQIADLTVETGGQSDGETMTVALKMLETKKVGWREQLQYWQDALMNRNAVGYAKPKAANFRTAGGQAPSRDV